MIVAQPAFWAGLIYDDAAQKAAAALVRDWGVEEIRALRAAAPAEGLHASIRGRRLQEVAKDALAIARGGLQARGLGEEVYLAPLEEIAESGLTQADRMLAQFHGAWGGDAGRALGAMEV
jgi:glutamate--cysteine ligase